MKDIRTYINVETSIGRTTVAGGLTILYGQAPAWKYCVEFYKTIMEGAAAVAVVTGIETEGQAIRQCAAVVFIDGSPDEKNDWRSALVAYSDDPDYRLGKSYNEENARLIETESQYLKEHGLEDTINITFEELDALIKKSKE
jgi:hypothetical protein